MLKVVIVEDEANNREYLTELLGELPLSTQIIGTADAVATGFDLLRQQQPDVALLDIELQDGTSFDLLEKLGHVGFDIIFTTAFEHYALKAIKFSSLDYLLKPVNAEELKVALEKAAIKKSEQDRRRQLEVLLNGLNGRTENQNICLSTAEGIEFIKVSAIKYCEANGSYTNFILENDQKLVVSKNLKAYENILNDNNFMRVHHGSLINLREVKRFVKSDGGYILMKNGATISIAQKKRDEFLERMASLS